MNRRIFLAADFNVETLARILENETLPDWDVRTAGGSHVIPALNDTATDRESIAVVWTRPEGVSEGFGRALAFEAVDHGRVLEEVRAFASAVVRFAARTRATIVPSWVLPPWHRGSGPLEFREGVGIARLLSRMNLALADALAVQPNVFMLDAAQWVAASGRAAWSDKSWFAAKSPFTPALFEHAAAEIAAATDAIAGTARRIVIVDLDELLWGGIVGEVGWEGLRIGGHDHVGEAFLAFQHALKGLTRRGVQLAVVSKNDEAVAVEAIDRHPEMILRRSDFAGWRINWNDKAENVVALLADIGLGAESAVFIDDSAIERARVAAAVPGILVPDWPADPARFRESLASLRCFDTTAITDEDRERTRMYGAERTRKQRLAEGASVEEWLASLGIVVTVEPLNAANLERAAQLFNKTNQMNLATRRLSASELTEWAASADRALLTFRVADRFGDSGLTGIVGLERQGDEMRLVDFLLSCRVMGRGVEEALLHAAVAETRRRGARTLSAEWRPTPRNGPCLAFFERSGMRQRGAGQFEWDATTPYACPRAVTLVSREWT